MRTLRGSTEQQSMVEARVRDDERTHLYSALRLGLHYDSHLYHQLTYVFSAREQVSPVLWSRDAVAKRLPEASEQNNKLQLARSLVHEMIEGLSYADYRVGISPHTTQTLDDLKRLQGMLDALEAGIL